MRNFALLTSTLLSVRASRLEVTIHYPESVLNPASGVFIIGLSTACYGTDACPNYTLPWGFDNPAQVVTNADKTGTDTWVKSVDLGSDFVGRAYVQLASFVDLAGPVIVVPSCYASNQGIVSFPVCLQQQMPWYADAAMASSHVGITIYPSFGVQLGATVTTAVTDLYSPQFNNTRSIYTFVPPSVAQNTVSRPVNVLILNDGTEPTLQSFVSRAGVDNLMQSGAIPSDLVIIGVPYVGGDIEGNRRAEFVFEACDGEKLACAAGPPYIGVGEYMEFIKSLVVPQVMLSIGMEKGDVAVAGMSLGALASCAMASADPAYFQRALCLSPSVWWNFGPSSEIQTRNLLIPRTEPDAR